MNVEKGRVNLIRSVESYVNLYIENCNNRHYKSMYGLLHHAIKFILM